MQPAVPVRRKILARRRLRAKPVPIEHLRLGFEILKSLDFLTVGEMCLIGVTNKEATFFWPRPRPASLKIDKHNKTQIIQDAQGRSNVWDLDLTFNRGGQYMVNWLSPGICARRIKRLTIRYFGGSSWGAIDQCVNLKTIKLSCSDFTVIPNLPSLTSICIETCPSIDNFDFRLCERLQTLQIANFWSEVRYPRTKCVLPPGLCKFEVVGYALDIRVFPASLETVVMENCGLTTLQCLAPLPKLAFLDIKRNSNLRDLGSLPISLVQLNLSNSENLNDDVLGTLPLLPCLQNLQMSNCPITNICFTKKCPSLEFLDVSYCEQLSSLNLECPPRRFDTEERERIIDVCFAVHTFRIFAVGCRLLPSRQRSSFIYTSRV